MPLTAQVAPHPALKDQATARSHTELGSDEHDDEEALMLMARKGSYDYLWRQLIKDQTDSVMEHSPIYAWSVWFTTRWPVTLIGMAAALSTSAGEIYTAYTGKGKYSLGYTSGLAALTLLVGIVSMHCVHLGGFWGQQLMSDSIRGKSYYEVLDVLFKDISASCFEKKDKVQTSERLSSMQASKKLRDRSIESVKENFMYMFVPLVLALLGVVYYAYLTAKHGIGAVLFKKPALPAIHVLRYKIQWLGLSQCLLHVLGACYMATGIMSIYLAAMLHRRHTIMFVQWVSSNRWVPNPEAKPLPHSDPNTGTINLAAETTPATGMSSAEANSGDNIQGVAETAPPVGAPSTKGEPAPTATGEKNTNTAPDKSPITQGTTAVEPDKQLIQNIGEAYLFMQKLFRRSSDSWSIVLAVWILLTVTLFFLMAIAYVIVERESKGYAAAISIICFILSVIPIVIIAYTNGFVDIILTTVRNSSLDDYEIIGGRERWLTYIGGNPTYWYIVGFALTKSWLLGFLSGAISTIGLLGLQSLTSR